MLFQKREGLSEQVCQTQLKFLSENVETKNLFDSNAIIKNIIESTEKYSFNKYDECLRFHRQEKDHGLMRGKYCTISSSSPIVKYIGLCYPDSCSDNALKEISKNFLKENDYTLKDHSCRTTQFEYELVDYLSISFFILLALIVLGSTICDYRQRKQTKKSKFLTTFSIYSNVKKVFEASSSDDVNCLYALRVLSILWLIIANRFQTMTKFPLIDDVTYNEWLKNGFSVFIASSDVAYDTFFIVSGFLLSTYCMKAFAAKSMNYFHLLLHRYFRYVPLLAATIFYYVSILKFTITGPLVYRLEKRIENCQNNWWTTLLLIENYAKPNETCLYDGWYFNIDFQFFIILPILVSIYYKFRKVGSVILYTILIASNTAIITIFILADTPYNVVNRISTYSMQSHYRCAPWIISVFLASICMQKNEIKMKKSTQIICWIGTVLIFITHFVIIYYLQNEEFSVNENYSAIIIGAIFAGVHRILWSIAIAWIIIACFKLGSKGILQRFLNSPKWKPFGKLTVTLLIIHPLYQIATTYCMKAPYAFDSWLTFHAGLGDIIFTTFLAIFLYASIEVPFVTIEQNFHVKRKNLGETQEIQLDRQV